MLNKRIPLVLMCRMLCVLSAHTIAAFDKWDVEITPALHRMIVEELGITDADARQQADAVLRVYQDEAGALDKTFNDLLQWNGGLMPNDHGAIDDDVERHVRRNVFRFEKQNRAARWSAVAAYFDQLGAIPSVDEDLLRCVRERHIVLLTLNDRSAPKPIGVKLDLDEGVLRDLPSFDDEARRILREAIDAYTVEIEPLVRAYRRAAEPARELNSLLNLARRQAIAGEPDRAQETRRTYIQRGVDLAEAALPIRAAHERFVATAAAQLTPEQAHEFRRATALLWSPYITHMVTPLLRVERALGRADLPAARRNELEKQHAALMKIIDDSVRAIKDSGARFEDVHWQRALYTFMVDNTIAVGGGSPPPDPPATLPDYNAIVQSHFQEVGSILQAIERYLPQSDEERQP